MIQTFGYGDPDAIPASFGYGEAGGVVAQEEPGTVTAGAAAVGDVAVGAAPT